MNKLNLLLITVLLVGTVGATLVFEPSERAELIVDCFDVDDSVCGTTAQCNLTTLYPNMTILIDTQPMTNQEYYFNYTTPVLETRGVYHNILMCSKDGIDGYGDFDFTVTSFHGTEQGNVAIGVLFSVVAIAFLFAFIGFKFSQSDKTFYFALFFILMTFVVVIYSIYLGYAYSTDILFSGLASGGQLTFYMAIMFSLTFIALLGLTLFFVKAIKEFRVRKSLTDHGEGYDEKSKTYNY